jgi:hypothetical protein
MTKIQEELHPHSSFGFIAFGPSIVNAQNGLTPLRGFPARRSSNELLRLPGLRMSAQVASPRSLILSPARYECIFFVLALRASRLCTATNQHLTTAALSYMIVSLFKPVRSTEDHFQVFTLVKRARNALPGSR